MTIQERLRTMAHTNEYDSKTALAAAALLDEAERVVEVFARCPTQGKEGGRFVIANAIYEDMGKGKSAPREAYWHKSDFDAARAFLAKLRKEQDDVATD